MADDPGPPAAPDQPPGRPGAPGEGAPGSPSGPGQILSDLARLRRRTRRARHAYWFPLLLFGLLTCAAAPLYAWVPVPAVFAGAPLARIVPAHLSGPFLLGGTPFGTAGVYLGWYWAFALIGGFLLTWLWYRHHARKSGVQTPARGVVVTGVVLSVLVLAVPPLTVAVFPWVAFGALWMRGTIACLVIAAGLWALAGAERSRALTVIVLVYTAAALLSCLYDVENVLFRLGWNPGPGRLGVWLAVLPTVLLPAVVLLVGGLGAYLAQRARRPA